MTPLRFLCYINLLVASLLAITTVHAQSPYQLNALTCPAIMPTMQSCYDTDNFTLHYGTGAGQTTFIGMSGTGTVGFVPRFATGGINLENSTLFNDPTTGNIGINTSTPGERLHSIGEVAGRENLQLDMYRDNSAGVGAISRRARGTLAAPVVLNDNDIIGLLNNSFGYVRNAADTANEFVQLASIRTAVDGLDAQGRAGARLTVFTSPGVSAPIAAVFTVTSQGNVGLHSAQSNATMAGTGATKTLVFGPGVAPSTSPTDTVQLTAVDRGGTAGKRSLAIRTEDGTSHILGDRVGIGTVTPGTPMEVVGTLNVSGAGEIQSAGVRVGHNLSVYAAGTAYSLTNSAALLNFGTTDPQLTINQPGTYLLHARAALRYTAATFAANQTVTLLVQRTNNTPGAVANSTITLTTRIITTITDHMAVATFPALVYTTANSTDALELQGSVSVVPSAGSLDVYEASLVAVRLF